MRVKLTIAYDGTNYCGWQIQDNGITVQQVVRDAIAELLGEEINLVGASRTDSGVHALGQVAVFDTSTRMPADKICFALNQRLPEDISVLASEEVSEDFHPRYDAHEKTYIYRILNTTHRIPQYRHDTFFYHHQLDEAAMNEAARCLVGEHDFESFASAGRQTKTTVRTIYEASVTREGDIVTFKVRGNGFLYNMVRIIAGTLIEIGGGKREVSAMEEALLACDRNAAGPTAPPEGLTLVEIKY